MKFSQGYPKVMQFDVVQCDCWLFLKLKIIMVNIGSNNIISIASTNNN